MHIVLMRSADESDAYTEALNQLGKVYCISVLSFQFVNLEKLKEQMKYSESYGGIIFTSKRAVEAVSSCTPNEVVSSWKEKPCYVVGEATSAFASNLGFNCVGKESGNAERLAQIIIETTRESSDLPLLFVCGQLRKDTLPSRLKENNIPFKTTTVYETICDPYFLNKVQAHVHEYGCPSHIVFFSPSGYKFSCEIWKNILGDSYNNVHLVSIGPSTAFDMQCTKHGIIVAEKPKPLSLFEAILHDNNKQS